MESNPAPQAVRLIDVLKARGLSPKEAREALHTGKVLLSGVPTADGGREVAPEAVRYDPSRPRMQPGRDPALLYQDAHLAVLYKPAGMLAVPATGRTETNMLAFAGRLLGSALAVHRIDEGTSGAMVVARSAEAQERLKELWEAHRVERTYLALALGRVSQEERRVHSFLIRDRGDGRRGSWKPEEQPDGHGGGRGDRQEGGRGDRQEGGRGFEPRRGRGFEAGPGRGAGRAPEAGPGHGRDAVAQGAGGRQHGRPGGQQGRPGGQRGAPAGPPEDAKESVTLIRGLSWLMPSYRKGGKPGQGGVTLVQARLETGRTHQVRIHLAEAGHALLGDGLYGGQGVERLFPRVALHAAVLGFTHPLTLQPLRWEVPLADDMEIWRRDHLG